MLTSARINLSKVFGQMFFRIFCGLNISCPDDVDVSFKLAEIFDFPETGNSTSIKLYVDLLTKFLETL